MFSSRRFVDFGVSDRQRMVEYGHLGCYCREEKSKGQNNGGQVYSPKREITSSVQQAQCQS